jgi:pimeloyl-ACP methyl ester carboxylesterase
VIGQVELEYELLGSPDGAPLLLIGGLGTQLVSWDDRFCDLLAERGYLVIRYDHRDSGRSTVLDHLGVPDLLGLLWSGGSPPYLLDDLAADAVGLLDHLAIESAHVVGLSMGGMVAQLLALTYPERVRTLVVALSGPPGRPSALPAPAVVDALLRPPGTTFAERVESAVALRIALAGEGAEFDIVEARRRAELQVSRSYQPEGTMRQAAAVLATPNLLEDLPLIQAPTLVVHGERDPLVPFAAAEAVAAAIPGAVLFAIPGLGHDLPPAVAADLIDRIAAFHGSRDLPANREFLTVESGD